MSIPSSQNEHNLMQAYNQMLLRIQNSITHAHAGSIPTLQKAIDMAKSQALLSGEINLHMADEIATYIKHDINDAAEYLMETSHDFSEWLMLDIDVVEQKVLKLFFSVAETTRRDLAKYSHTVAELSHQRLPPPTH